MKIEHHADDQQFVAIDKETVGFLNYTILPDKKTLDYQHTFVPPEFRGRHIAQNLVKFPFDFAKENDYKVIPTCPFVKLFIDRHPEYKDLIKG